MRKDHVPQPPSHSCPSLEFFSALNDWKTSTLNGPTAWRATSGVTIDPEAPTSPPEPPRSIRKCIVFKASQEATSRAQRADGSKRGDAKHPKAHGQCMSSRCAQEGDAQKLMKQPQTQRCLSTVGPALPPAAASAEMGCCCAPDLQPLGPPLDPHEQMHPGPCLSSLDNVAANINIPDFVPHLPAEFLRLDHNYAQWPHSDFVLWPCKKRPRQSCRI